MKEITKQKAIIYSLAAIGILGVSQIASQLIASLFEIIGVPTGICNIIAGILYVAGTLLLAKIFFGKVAHIDLSELGISKPSFKWIWVLVAILLPVAIIAFYILLVPGEWAPSDLSSEKKFELLSAGIFFIGMGAGFVEEMVFR